MGWLMSLLAALSYVAGCAIGEAAGGGCWKFAAGGLAVTAGFIILALATYLADVPPVATPAMVIVVVVATVGAGLGVLSSEP